MQKTKTKNTTKKYSLILEINGQVFNKRTNDIKKTIMDLTPEFVFTEVFITVKKGKERVDRILNLKQAKKLFQNEDVLDVFIMNLMLE